MEYTYDLRYVMGDTLVLSRIHPDITIGIAIDESNPEYQKYLDDTDGGLPLPPKPKAV